MLQKSISRAMYCHKPTILLHQLQRTGPKVSEFLLSTVLTACAKLAALEQGKQTHCTMWKHGFYGDLVLMTSLLNMYSKCAAIEEARQVFAEMPQRDVVAANSMIYALCRCYLTSDAVQLFATMSQKDVGSWNSLISGLGQNLAGGTALLFFRKMRTEGVKMDAVTLVSVLSICSNLAALAHGKQCHCVAIKYGFELYLPVGNATIDMYAKGGCVQDACLCLKSMPVKNVVSWTSLIVGYGRQGLGFEALEALKKMEIEGIVPNEVTFLGTLYACSHAGLVEEGWRSFNAMIHKYSITPLMEHYTCMVDILARAGRMDEAYSFIETMPVKPDARLLTAFLSSCCSHRNLELGLTIGQKLLELQPEEAGAYMLLSNFYGILGDLEGVANVRRLMLDRGIKKEKACTTIEVDGELHSFESSDRSHPATKEIINYLEDLIERIKNSYGYVPNTSLVVQNVNDQAKEQILLGHSEKLAIGLGLIRTTPGTRITIVKNLRVCLDCHVVTGLISKIEGREIVARDSSRFHHFKDGVCSCRNHW